MQVEIGDQTGLWMSCRSGLLGVGSLVILLLGVAGCQQATLLTVAVVCQGTQWQVEGESPDGWTFKGLDARVCPRIRPGSYPSATYGVRFLNARNLGSHGYRFSWSEKNGIVYTCRAGHIDIAHLRKAADWTGFLAANVFRLLEREETGFRFKLREPSMYFVELEYPADWRWLSRAEQRRIACDVSQRLGQYLSYTALTWHEILTWFGFRSVGYKSEFPSAFSWEDMYSNLLGTHVALSALRNDEHAFSKAVTLALKREMEELGPQPAHVARQAANSVRGEWFSDRWFDAAIWKRNLDVGLDDGYVTPCLTPGVPACEEAQPQPLAVPTLDFLANYGFTMRLEIEARVWEENKILDVLYPYGGRATKRLEPVAHFPRLISHIEDAATGTYSVDTSGKHGF